MKISTHRSRWAITSRHVAIGAASASALLGLIVLTGWYTHIELLIQVHPDLVPMQYNTALAFLLAGAGLLANVFGRSRLAIVCGSLVATIGILTLIEYVAQISLGVDQLLMDHYVTVETSHPGRMAPNTALCFTLAGCTLLLFATPSLRRLKQQPLIIAALGSITGALELIAFAGYSSGLEDAYGWGLLTHMAVHTAVAFVIFGFGTVALVWHENGIKDGLLPQWFPVPVAIGALTLTVALYAAMRYERDDRIRQEVRTEATTLTNSITAETEYRILALRRMADRWSQRGGTPRSEWEADARAYINDQLGYQAIQWIDSTFRPRWIVPLEGTTATQEQLHEVLEFAHQRRDRDVAATHAIELEQGDKACLVYASVFVGDEFDGFIVGVFHIEETFHWILQKHGLANHPIAVFDGSQLIFSQGGGSRQRDDQWSHETFVECRGVTWRARLWPETGVMAGTASYLPEVVLTVGMFGSFLLALSVGLIGTSSRQAMSMRSLNRNLASEVTARKRAEQALKGNTNELARSKLELEHTLRMATTAASVGTWHWVIAEDKFAWSDTCSVLFGMPVDTVMSREQFLQAVHPDDRDRTRIALSEALSNRGDYRLEYRVVWPDGQVHWLEAMGHGFYDDDGKATHMQGVVLDITDRKRADAVLQQDRMDLERRVEDRTAELRQSNHDLEQFAYVASHDLQEPLRMVSSYLQLLQRRYDEALDDDAREFITYAVDGAARMKQLIEDLLSFSRVGTKGKEPTPTDCETIVTRALANLEVAIDEAGANVTYERLPVVPADDVQLVQLFQNLIGNAIKYRDHDRRPEVHISAVESDGEWKFAVRDNSIGIDPQFAERIFAIFQRLHRKDEYSGTGIGLSVCKKIVERHGGRIWVESKLGHGSTFFFTIPKIKEQDSHAQRAA